MILEGVFLIPMTLPWICPCIVGASKGALLDAKLNESRVLLKCTVLCPCSGGCERQTYGGVVNLIIETNYFLSRHNSSLDCAIDLIQVPMYSLKQELSFGTAFRYICLMSI